MYTLLVIIYILVALFLIMVVLLQSGKGASMGAAFGGGAQTMFGARGKASGIEKVTVWAAVIFMVLSVALASLSSQTRSSLDEEPGETSTTGEAGLLPSKPAAGASDSQPASGDQAAGQPAAAPQDKSASTPADGAGAAKPAAAPPAADTAGAGDASSPPKGAIPIGAKPKPKQPSSSSGAEGQ